MDERFYYVYILANESGNLYIGVTNSIRRRIHEHKQGTIEGFTKKYQIHKLVYVESFNYIHFAIAREKRLKVVATKMKKKLIESTNPDWKDLAEDWYEEDP